MVSAVKWSGLSEGHCFRIIDTVDPAAVLELGEGKSCSSPLGTRGSFPEA